MDWSGSSFHWPEEDPLRKIYGTGADYSNAFSEDGPFNHYGTSNLQCLAHDHPDLRTSNHLSCSAWSSPSHSATPGGWSGSAFPFSTQYAKPGYLQPNFCGTTYAPSPFGSYIAPYSASQSEVCSPPQAYHYHGQDYLPFTDILNKWSQLPHNSTYGLHPQQQDVVERQHFKMPSEVTKSEHVHMLHGSGLCTGDVPVADVGLSLPPNEQHSRFGHAGSLEYAQPDMLNNSISFSNTAATLNVDADGRCFSELWPPGTAYIDAPATSSPEFDLYGQGEDLRSMSSDGALALGHLATWKLDARSQIVVNSQSDLLDLPELLKSDPPFDALDNRRVTLASSTLDFSSTFHGLLNVDQSRRKMGQEASQILPSEGAKPQLVARKTEDGVDVNEKGWTAVNGTIGNERSPLRESVHVQTNGKKRKRTLDLSDGSRVRVKTGDDKVAGATTTQHHLQQAHDVHRPHVSTAIVGQSRTLQNGLGITMPRTGRAASISSEDSVLAPTPEVALKVQSSGNIKGQNKDGAGHSDSESDVDTDALGLLQRIAAADSDDEEDHATSSPVKARDVPTQTQSQPSANQQHPGWPQQNRAPAGTHYTIYSPLVQPSGYPQPRPNESFDPNAPLSAHEEAQLRDEGRFTKMEQSFLKDAIDEYCKRHGISVQLANDYVCGKAREGNIPGDFWDEVCKALPQRTKNSIQRAAKRVFRNNQKKGPWTKEEEDALAEAYHKTPDQWAKICEEVPGRSAEQCRDRWRNYTQNGVKLTRGPWTDAEENQFVDICKRMLGQARLERESQRRSGRTVSEKFEPIDHLNFTTISSMMGGSRSRLHCRNKWHKLKKRPDIEAAIEAVITGDSIAGFAPSDQEPPPQRFSLPPMPASQTAPHMHGSQQTYGPLGAPINAPSMPPPILSAPSAALPISRPGQVHPAPPNLPVASATQASTIPTAYHTFRPSPVQAFNQVQSVSPGAIPAQYPQAVSASMSPHTYSAMPAAPSPPSRSPPKPLIPNLASPAVASPAVRVGVSVAAPLSNPSPPTWAAQPPPVPQLFTPSTATPAATSTALNHRATPGPKRGSSFTSTATPLSRLASSQPFSPAQVSPLRYGTDGPKPSSEQHLGRAHIAAPTNTNQPDSSSTSSKAPLASIPRPVHTPTHISTISHAPALNASIVPAAPTLQTRRAEAAPPSPHGKVAMPASNSTSPESRSPAASNEDKPEGRPIRKKQKTAKARGDD